MGTWEHRAILEGSKGTRIPLGDPYLITERKERTGLQPNLTGESRTGIINLSQDTPLDLT